MRNKVDGEEVMRKFYVVSFYLRYEVGNGNKKR